MRMGRGLARTALRLAVSVGLLGWLVARADVAALRTTLGAVDGRWLAVAVGLYAAGQAVSALKWALLGRAVGLDAPIGRYVRFYWTGMLVNVVGLATVGGDAVRALALGAGGRGGLAFASVAFDRLAGLAVLAALGAAAVILVPGHGLPRAAALVAGAVGLGLFVAWLAAPAVVRLLPPTSPIRRPVEGDLAPFWRDHGLLARVIALSATFHLSQVLLQHVLGRALGVTIPLAYCLVFHPVLAIATSIPVSVSGLGVREGGYVWFLGRIGIAPRVGVAMGLVWWVVGAAVALAVAPWIGTRTRRPLAVEL